MGFPQGKWAFCLKHCALQNEIWNEVWLLFQVIQFIFEWLIQRSRFLLNFVFQVLWTYGKKKEWLRWLRTPEFSCEHIITKPVNTFIFFHYGSQPLFFSFLKLPNITCLKKGTVSTRKRQARWMMDDTISWVCLWNKILRIAGWLNSLSGTWCLLMAVCFSRYLGSTWVAKHVL